MPRDHGRILTIIWRDKDFQQRSVEAQRMYMLLLSQPNVNNAGVLPLQLSKWAKGCDQTSVADVRRATNELAEHLYVAYDEDTEELLVRSYIRNDGVLKHKYLFANALKCAQAVESPSLRAVLAAELRRTRRADAVTVANQIDPSGPGPDGTPTDPRPDDDPTPPDSDLDGIWMPSETDPNGIENPSQTDVPLECHSDGIGITRGKGKGRGKGSPWVGGYVGETPTRCAKHINDPHPPNCRDCMTARLASEAAAQEAAERQKSDRAAALARREACTRCQGGGWIEADDGSGVLPCTCRKPLQLVPHPTDAQRAAG
ncbi:Uncharacterised protein [Mycobacteroides abscessus subsp. abscessus]|nr:Uncharacterised protein [Mycobacteroides abscessus subsp. abscessus]SHY25133.1 Uncharacterised protein [Mycobacteroides abscessus subsp. abscessus]SIC27655.1 Uncharacterised protein [Mycobacteroides abscessus subsp. abscessus]SKV39857.1 Uncharacterised protein [Mycobacteroides abscessus subsp. abscessus]